MRVASKAAVVLALLTSVLLVDVVAAKNKDRNVPLDPKFAGIQSITLLPVVDLRIDKKDRIDLAKIGERAVQILKDRNYPAVQADSTGTAGEIAEEDLQESKAEWIKRLGLSADRWIMVVCLFDVHTKRSQTNAEFGGYLFDKETGEVIWKRRGFGQAGDNTEIGGLSGMGLRHWTKKDALNNAVDALLGSIPKR
jgi:hypothetical protein